MDRVPDELWNEVRDIVHEIGIKTIPMEKKCKEAKQLSEEAIQIAKKRSERQKIKGKIYPTECEFQRILRRDKKQCTEGCDQNNPKEKERQKGKNGCQGRPHKELRKEKK